MASFTTVNISCSLSFMLQNYEKMGKEQKEFNLFVISFNNS